MRCNLFQTSILLFLAATIPVLSAQGLNGRWGLLFGGWKPVNANDPAIQAIGKFAVDQDNLIAKVPLAFVAVKSGESQVVRGINYRLIISAKAGATTGDYQAVVYVHPDQSKELVSFTPANA